jgi:predicted flap endonuclease-1-like 5' DNA nuclease
MVLSLEDIMADETKVEPQAEEAKAATGEKKPSPPLYKITNVVRRVNTRTRRAAAPGRRRFKQYVCGRRLLRKQTMTVSGREMELYRDQLMEQVKAGAITITAPDGTVISADVHGNIVSRKGLEVSVATPPKKEAPKKEEETEQKEEERVKKEEEPLKKVDTVEEESEDVVADDLTQLPGVGPGRAKKLTASGVVTFKQIAEMSPGDLVKIVGSPLTEDQAADICDAASDMEG